MYRKKCYTIATFNFRNYTSKNQVKVVLLSYEIFVLDSFMFTAMRGPNANTVTAVDGINVSEGHCPGESTKYLLYKLILLHYIHNN